MQTEPSIQSVQYIRISAEAARSSKKICSKSAECVKSKASWCASQHKLRWMANQLLSIQENERRRIAMDLHDGLGQSLTIIKLALANAKSQLDAGAVYEAADLLQKLKFSVHEALEEVRQVSKELRPPMLDHLGILPTLTCFMRELEAACPGLKVARDFSIAEEDIPAALKITIYRILQEACSNIVKHAHADLIWLRLHKLNDVLSLSIEDNGDGFDPDAVSIRVGSERGLGLLGMKERAELSGGIFGMASVLDQGTHIHVSWQLNHTAESPATPDFGVALG